MCSGGKDWNRGAVMSGYVYPSVRARLVDVWRQMSDMLSFWIIGLGLGLGLGPVENPVVKDE